MMRSTCNDATSPSPVVLKPRKVRWPLCSPPRLKPCRSISSITLLSPTGVRTTRPPPASTATSRPPLLMNAPARPPFSLARAPQRLFLEQPVGQEIQRGNGHDIVSVEKNSFFVAQQDAVGVAVVSNDEVGAMFPDFLDNEARMNR